MRRWSSFQIFGRVQVKLKGAAPTCGVAHRGWSPGSLDVEVAEIYYSREVPLRNDRILEFVVYHLMFTIYCNLLYI